MQPFRLGVLVTLCGTGFFLSSAASAQSHTALDLGTLGGTTLVISSSSGKADTTVVTVLPAGSTYCTGLATATPMAVRSSK